MYLIHLIFLKFKDTFTSSMYKYFSSMIWRAGLNQEKKDKGKFGVNLFSLLYTMHHVVVLL